MDFRETYSNTCSSIGAAVRSNNLLALKRLIKQKKPDDVQDNRGWRPLHEAAALGHLECLKELLQNRDTDLNWRTFEGETAVFLSTKNNQWEVLKLLLNRGADPNIANNEEFSPLHCACSYSEGQTECVRMLLKYKAHLNDKDFQGYTPLHCALLDLPKSPIKFDLISMLLNEKEINLELKDTYHNRTVLFMAAQNGDIEILRLLYETSVVVRKLINDQANDGASAFMIACQARSLPCVKFLYRHGADMFLLADSPETRSIRWIHALHFAIELNDIQIAEYLIKKTPDGYYHSHFLQVVANDHSQFMGFQDINSCGTFIVADRLLPFVQQACDTSILTYALDLKRAEIVNLLLQHIYADEFCPRERCLLLNAHLDHFLKVGDADTCIYLMDYGACIYPLGKSNDNSIWPSPIETALNSARLFAYMMKRGAAQYFGSLSQVELLRYLEKASLHEKEVFAIAMQNVGYLALGNCRFKSDNSSTRGCFLLQKSELNCFDKVVWNDVCLWRIKNGVKDVIYVIKLLCLYGGQEFVTMDLIKEVAHFAKEGLAANVATEYKRLVDLVKNPFTLQHCCALVVGRRIQKSYPDSLKEQLKETSDSVVYNDLFFDLVYNLEHNHDTMVNIKRDKKLST